jgi:very-short-patch-repair endonuclease
MHAHDAQLATDASAGAEPRVVHGDETGDRAIAGIAARQHGVVTRAQLLAAGLGRGGIAHRLAERRLHRLHRGVFLVGHVVAPPLAREMAAVLACRAGAVVSHFAAASMWSLPFAPADVIDVTVAGRNPGTRPGLRIHVVARLGPRDMRVHERVPVTAPARTLLDLAALVPLRDLERALNEARIRRLVRSRQLLDVLERSPGRRGAGALRGLLDNKPALTRSEAEARLLALLRAAGLPPDGVNVRVERYEVDFLWRAAGVIVEVDGYAYHSTRAAFERDRIRDAELQAAGYQVMRVTWRQLIETSEAVVALIAQVLASNARR